MSYCTNCGKEFKEGHQYCPSCGAKTDAMGFQELKPPEEAEKRLKEEKREQIIQKIIQEEKLKEAWKDIGTGKGKMKFAGVLFLTACLIAVTGVLLCVVGLILSIIFIGIPLLLIGIIAFFLSGFLGVVSILIALIGFIQYKIFKK